MCEGKSFHTHVHVHASAKQQERRDAATSNSIKSDGRNKQTIGIEDRICPNGMSISRLYKALSTLETIVDDLGDNSPFLATVAEFGDSRRFWRQSQNWATIVASVDRP